MGAHVPSARNFLDISIAYGSRFRPHARSKTQFAETADVASYGIERLRSWRAHDLKSNYKSLWYCFGHAALPHDDQNKVREDRMRMIGAGLLAGASLLAVTFS